MSAGEPGRGPAPVDRVVPFTDDHDTGPFFAAAIREELAVCGCAACGETIHPPLPACPRCGGETTWKIVTGRGRLYSWTTVEHQAHPSFPVPYTIVLVELDDEPVKLLGYLPGRPALEAGMPMEAWFEPLGDGGTRLPQWSPSAP